VNELDELRARRRVLQERDDAVSYVRRVTQGRADLARAELARRDGGGESGVAVPEQLRDVLADRLLAGPGRPPRPVEDFSDHPLSDELDRRCAEHGFGRLDELDAAELAALTAVLDAFEAELSAERRAVFAELDSLTDELVVRYRDELADDQAGGTR